jgi:hypothetical protein
MDGESVDGRLLRLDPEIAESVGSFVRRQVARLDVVGKLVNRLGV